MGNWLIAPNAPAAKFPAQARLKIWTHKLPPRRGFYVIERPDLGKRPERNDRAGNPYPSGPAASRGGESQVQPRRRSAVRFGDLRHVSAMGEQRAPGRLVLPDDAWDGAAIACAGALSPRHADQRRNAKVDQAAGGRQPVLCRQLGVFWPVVLGRRRFQFQSHHDPAAAGSDPGGACRLHRRLPRHLAPGAVVLSGGR